MKIEKLCDIYSYLKHVLEHGFDLSLDGVNSGFEPPSFRNWHIHKFWEVKIQSPENPKQKYLLTIVPPGVVHSMTKREMSLDITHHCVSVSVDSKNAIWQIFSNNDGGSCNLLPELLHVTTQYAALPEYRQLCTGLTGNILTNLLLLIKSNIENRKPARHVRDITKYALTYMNNCYFKVDLSITEIASFIGVTPHHRYDHQKKSDGDPLETCQRTVGKFQLSGKRDRDSDRLAIPLLLQQRFSRRLWDFSQ